MRSARRRGGEPVRFLRGSARRCLGENDGRTPVDPRDRRDRGDDAGKPKATYASATSIPGTRSRHNSEKGTRGSDSHQAERSPEWKPESERCPISNDDVVDEASAASASSATSGVMGQSPNSPRCKKMTLAHMTLIEVCARFHRARDQLTSRFNSRMSTAPISAMNPDARGRSEGRRKEQRQVHRKRGAPS